MSKTRKTSNAATTLEVGSAQLDAVESAAGYCERVMAQLNIFAAALDTASAVPDLDTLASQIACQLREDCANDLDVAREMLLAMVPKAS